MSDKYHISNGSIKEHDGQPIKSGESVISKNLFSKLVELESDATIEKEKSKNEETKLKEDKFLSRLRVVK